MRSRGIGLIGVTLASCLLVGVAASAASAEFGINFSYGSYLPYGSYYYSSPYYSPPCYMVPAPYPTYQAPIVIAPSPLIWADADRWNRQMWRPYDRVYDNVWGRTGLLSSDFGWNGRSGSWGGSWANPVLPGVPMRGFDAGSFSIPQRDRFGR